MKPLNLRVVFLLGGIILCALAFQIFMGYSAESFITKSGNVMTDVAAIAAAAKAKAKANVAPAAAPVPAATPAPAPSAPVTPPTDSSQ